MNIIDGPVTPDTEPVDVVLGVLEPMLGPAAAEAVCDALFAALAEVGWSIGPNSSESQTPAQALADWRAKNL